MMRTTTSSSIRVKPRDTRFVTPQGCNAGYSVWAAPISRTPTLRDDEGRRVKPRGVHCRSPPHSAFGHLPPHGEGPRSSREGTVPEGCCPGMSAEPYAVCPSPWRERMGAAQVRGESYKGVIPKGCNWGSSTYPFNKAFSFLLQRHAWEIPDKIPRE